MTTDAGGGGDELDVAARLSDGLRAAHQALSRWDGSDVEKSSVHRRLLAVAETSKRDVRRAARMLEELREQCSELREPAPEPDPVPEVRIPNGPNRTRPLGANGSAATRTIPAPRTEEPEPAPLTSGLDIPDGVSVEEAYFAAYRQYVREQGHFPNARQFARYLPSLYGGTGPEALP